jgi:hypothetical protein
MPIQIRIQIGIRTMPILMGILPQVLHLLENQNFFTLCHSIVSLQCFIFLISVKCVIIFSAEIFLERSLVYLFHLFGIDTDPDPDLEKLRGSDPIRIRIHNTA